MNRRLVYRQQVPDEWDHDPEGYVEDHLTQLLGNTNAYSWEIEHEDVSIWVEPLTAYVAGIDWHYPGIIYFYIHVRNHGYYEDPHMFPRTSFGEMDFGVLAEVYSVNELF